MTPEKTISTTIKPDTDGTHVDARWTQLVRQLAAISADLDATTERLNHLSRLLRDYETAHHCASCGDRLREDNRSGFYGELCRRCGATQWRAAHGLAFVP